MIRLLLRLLPVLLASLAVAASEYDPTSPDRASAFPQDSASRPVIVPPARLLLAAGRRSQPLEPVVASGSGSGFRKSMVAGRLGTSTEPSGMIVVPAGTFRMGSPTNEFGRSSDERQWMVTLRQPFRVADHEVTQGEYAEVMGAASAGTGDPGLPVVMVSWNDAQKYCSTLTDRERTAGRLPPGEVYRLPTEAEWEYAARAGTIGSRYGNLDEIAWWAGNAGAEPQLPRGKGSNGFGIFDSIGNVSEWCSDVYGNYPEGSGTDPTGPLTGTRRVVRGGSWADGDRSSRAAWRGKEYPTSRLPTVGFRIVRAKPL
jgi:formylglycine-generating enzyme required for sulfatase activity